MSARRELLVLTAAANAAGPIEERTATGGDPMVPTCSATSPPLKTSSVASPGRHTRRRCPLSAAEAPRSHDPRRVRRSGVWCASEGKVMETARSINPVSILAALRLALPYERFYELPKLVPVGSLDDSSHPLLARQAQDRTVPLDGCLQGTGIALSIARFAAFVGSFSNRRHSCAHSKYSACPLPRTGDGHYPAPSFVESSFAWSKPYATSN